MKFPKIKNIVCIVAALVFGLVAVDALAQSSSLFGDPVKRAPMTLAQYSWIYQPVEKPREIRVHDVLTIIVDQKAQVISEGEIDRKKKANATLSLKDWILFSGFAFIPDPQTKGDPKISGNLDNKMKSEATLETREAMKFRIACTVNDIRPNGLLILEGRQSIRYNDEMWEMSLTGTVRPEDVLPNNTVLSENIANLRLFKRESGSVRDGYRRGWFLRWLDTYQPF